jgi:hypothetical protein
MRLNVVAWVKKGMALVAEQLELRDVLAFGGLALFGYGVHCIYPPAAWILCGAVLFWLGVKR